MKKHLLVAFALMISLSVFSQIEMTTTYKTGIVGKIDLAELSYKLVGNDTLYLFKYYNQKYQQLKQWKTLMFFNEKNAFNSLYAVLMSAFSEQNKANKDFFCKL